MGTLARVFPALEALKTSDTNRVELVNQTMVEEVLQDLRGSDVDKSISVLVTADCQSVAKKSNSK
jgi:hypothetical protein